MGLKQAVINFFIEEIKVKKEKKKKSKKKSYRLFWIIIGILIVGLLISILSIEPFKIINNETISENKENEIWDLFDNYEDKLTECSVPLFNYLATKEYGQARSQISLCQNIIANALVDINRLKRDQPEFKDDLRVAEMDYTGTNHFFNALSLITRLKWYPSTDEEIQQNWNNIAQIELLLRNSLYYAYYKPKKEYSYTEYYDRYYKSREKEIEEGVKVIVTLHNQLNQEINSYYDKIYGWEAKYFFQVNPNDPIIIEITDNLVENIINKEEIKWKIFKYVRNNVQYKYDPNWQTDWVQQPAITLLDEKGDCEDHAVLLASMFMRAGINNVQLCESDTNNDGKYDHMYVAVGDIVWDATCKDCVDSAPDDIENWKSICFDVNEVITNPESIERAKCPEGYVLGEDNLCHLRCGDGYCPSGTICCNNKCYSECSAGYIFGKDCMCHPKCDDGYCIEGICCNGKCVSCSSRYILGEDCMCHPRCSDGYCLGGSICCDNKCMSCPEGYYLAVDCKCYPK